MILAANQVASRMVVRQIKRRWGIQDFANITSMISILDTDKRQVRARRQVTRADSKRLARFVDGKNLRRVYSRQTPSTSSLKLLQRLNNTLCSTNHHTAHNNSHITMTTNYFNNPCCTSTRVSRHQITPGQPEWAGTRQVQGPYAWRRRKC